MQSVLKKAFSKSKHAIVAYHMYLNWLAGARRKRGDSRTLFPLHSEFQGEPALHVKNIEGTYSAYCEHGELTPSQLAGQRILEIGPGDSFGVGLEFLAHGARQIVCLDRFYCLRDRETELKIYTKLRETLSGEEQARFDAAIEIDAESFKFDPEKLSYIHDIGIEDADSELERGSFGLILSNAVLEHVYDCERAFDGMDRLLAPGGLMVHMVDLRDHGMFSAKGFHPLTFLTISDDIYRRMSVNTGSPNRQLIDFYRDKLTRMGYDFKFMTSNIVGMGDSEIFSPPKQKLVASADYAANATRLVEQIRPSLYAKYRSLSAEDLMVGTFILVARKPASSH